MLVEFHSRMEGMSSEDSDSMTDGAVIVVGFRPSSDFAENAKKAEELSAYLNEHEVLKNYSFEPASFHAGISWYGNPY